MEAIFCYGLAFCDVEWSFKNKEDLLEEQIDNFNYWDEIDRVKKSEDFINQMNNLNILISEWTFEDCSQLLLAHKNLFLETSGYEIVGKMAIEDNETEDLEKALEYVVQRVKDNTGIEIDFKVQPQCILAVNY